ncbi:MAG: RNA polymerase sigma factor, partial [Solirubrobacterales bacterium]
GDNWLRRELCEDAIRLGRMLATLAPDEAEVFGLLALIELQASRLNARVDADGNAILLLEQDRSRWDATAIANGLAALERAESLNEDYGPYTLQAEIAACHARAGEAAATDWRRIATLYGALGRRMPSPVVELNRAVAVGMAAGPQAGLDLIDQLVDDPALANYHLLPSVRGDLLDRLGRFAEARTEFERAASMTRNSRERDVLLKRAEGTVASDESDSRPS